MAVAKEKEAETRKSRIDQKLRSLPQPWTLIPYTKGMDTTALHATAVEEYPTESGPCDYALFVHGRLLAFLEAKKLETSAQNVLEQTKRYSRTVREGSGDWRGYRVPFVYSSNGESIYFWDARDELNVSRNLGTFHTADGLAELFQRQNDLSWLTQNPPTGPRLRPYQHDAIVATEGALIKRERSMLIAMATGTGKTFTTVSQIYRLLESKQYKRILFLVDRRALAVQAVREFASYNTPTGNKFIQEYEVYHQRFQSEDFDEDEHFDPKMLPKRYLTDPQPGVTFVYVSTIQRMSINLFGFKAKSEGEESEDDAEPMSIPSHAFDLIIADECHRGYTIGETAMWRATLDHFDAIRVGLTATPAAHTLAIFDRVVYRYTTEQAIQDGYLVDYEAVAIHSQVKMNGAFLKAGEAVGVVDKETGQLVFDSLEDERAFSTAEIERNITAPQSNRKIIEEIARYAREHEAHYGRFPKTLIFADNDIPHTSHADQLVKICRDVFGRGDDFVQKITGSPSVDRPLQKIRQFRNRPSPGVVVTVDMLSTGVDIPALEFVVFLRPVKSRILWVQMLGRGTRRCEPINKEKFVAFDCFGGTLFAYFKGVTDFDTTLPPTDSLSLGQLIEKIYQNDERDKHLRMLIKRLRRIERTMTGEARTRFADFIPDGNIQQFADELPRKLGSDFIGTMKLLRDEKFQDLLENYPRAKGSFLVGYEIEDTVTSQVMIHTGPGYQKPEDYLVSFTRFVRENPEHIEAFRILLDRPKDWRTDVLDDLRKKLRLNKFPEPELQKAVKLVHNKALADIISIVKHAAREVEPLLTAEERVDKALGRIRGESTFTEDQERWLGYIRGHLIQNLTLDLKDFDLTPTMEQRGGLRKARGVFGDQLESLIEKLNAAVAA